MRYQRALLCPTLAVLAASLPAVESPFVGPRGTAMGGANVASVDSAIAQFYNPAAFGFMNAEEETEGNDNNDLGERFLGINLIDAMVGYRITGDISDRLDEINNIDFDSLGNQTTYNESDVATLVEAANLLAGIDDPSNSIQIEANAGTHVRVGNLAVGARVHTAIGAAVLNVDLANLGLNYGDPNAPFDQARAGSTPTGSTLSAEQQDSLASAGLSSTNINYLDSVITQEVNNGTISTSEVNELLDVLTGVVDATGGVGSGGSLDDNATAVIVRGIGVLEVPVSYGYEVLEDFSVGGSAKLMVGRVYGATLFVTDEDNDEIIDNATDEYEQTINVGIDLALMYRLPTVNLAITGRNLNEPEFDGFTLDNGTKIADVTVERQVTIGAAWFPLPGLTVEGDLELLKKDSLVGDYETQFLAGGVEYDAFEIVALRGGAYMNIADDDIGPVLTGGVGLNLYVVRLDFAAGVSFSQEEFDDQELPSEARFSLGLASEF